MIRYYLFVLLIMLLGCSEPSIIINPSIAKNVDQKIDTLNAIKEYKESDTDLKEFFNSDLRVSYNDSQFFDSFASGGVSINNKGVLEISYRLAESAGPFFTIKISKNNKILAGKFQILGDDSPSISKVDIKIKKLTFNRVPVVGKSLCFFIEFKSNKWSFSKDKEQYSHLKIYGFINEIFVAEK